MGKENKSYMPIRVVGAIIIGLFLAVFVYGGDIIEIYFSPHGACCEEIIAELDSAEHTIDIAMYYLTSYPLTYKLIELSQKGVDIRIYLDEGQEGLNYSKGAILEDSGIDVKYEHGTGLMHNKFCVIDDKTVITGSYNWTQRAEDYNDENVVIIHDQQVAHEFSAKFQEYWGGFKNAA